MTGAVPRSTWIALSVATAAVIAIAAVVMGLWSAVGDTQISVAGWLAMVFGALATLALGIGLMALVFISSRRGYDDAGGDPRR